MTRKFYSSFTAIYDHFQARSAKTFMNIHGSLMTIFDQKRNSFIAIYDHSQARSAKTFMNIYGFIDDHS